MTRILFCVHSVVETSAESIDPFYQGFIQTLAKYDNEVFIFKTNNFLANSCYEQTPLFTIDKDKLDAYIKKLEPDFIFTFNNSLYDGILKYTCCPVIFWSSESLYYLFSKSLLEKYIDRYYFFHFSDGILKQFQETFFSKSDRNYLVQCPTALVARNIDQDKNISFIGTINQVHQNISKLYNNFPLVKNKSIYEYLDSILLEAISSPLNFDIKNLKKLKNMTGVDIKEGDILDLLSRNFRIEILDSVSSLGLKIYGSTAKKELSIKNPELLSSCCDEIVDTIEKTEEIYNSSKICIQIPHPQSTNGMSWRVPEIMASNAILVARKGIQSVYGKKFKLPMYENAFEAKSICDSLLANSNMRADLRSISHEIINTSCRVEHRLKELSEIFGYNFLKSDKTGKVTFISHLSFQKKYLKGFESVTKNVLNILPPFFVRKLGEVAKTLGLNLPSTTKIIYRKKL